MNQDPSLQSFGGSPGCLLHMAGFKPLVPGGSGRKVRPQGRGLKLSQRVVERQGHVAKRS